MENTLIETYLTLKMPGIFLKTNKAATVGLKQMKGGGLKILLVFTLDEKGTLGIQNSMPKIVKKCP